MQRGRLACLNMCFKNSEVLVILIPDGRQIGAGQDGVFPFELEGDDGVGADLARPLPQLVKHVLVEVLLRQKTEWILVKLPMQEISA